MHTNVGKFHVENCVRSETWGSVYINGYIDAYTTNGHKNGYRTYSKARVYNTVPFHYLPGGRQLFLDLSFMTVN